MSLEHLDILEKALRPGEVITRFAGDISVSHHNDCLSIPCPRCTRDTWVLSTGLLCSNKDCTFRAGSVVDWLATRLGGFQPAVEQLFSQFGDQLTQLGIYQASQLIPAIAKAAIAKRTLFEFFLRLRLDASGKITQAQASAWLDQQNIDYLHVQASVYPATAEDMKTLQRLCQNLGISISVPTSACVLFPYFGNHHSVAEVVAHTRGQKFHLTCLPYRFSYFGLNEGRPDVSAQLCYAYMDAAVLNSRYHTYQPDRVCFGLWHNPFSRRMGYVPRKPVYLYDPDQIIRVPAAFSRSCPDLLVGSKDDRFTLSWNEFLVTEIVRQLVDKRTLTSEIKLFLETAKLEQPEQARIFMALKQANLYDLGAEVEEHLRSGPVYQLDTISLFETPAGYYLTRKEGDYKTQVSNFTMKLESNLVFPDSNELFHTGYLLFQGTKYPLMLENHALDKATDLEGAARAAEARIVTDSVGLVPTVSDRAGLKHAQAYLRALTARLPRSEGLQRLGWNGRRDVFATPTRRIREVITEVRHVFHPDIEVLRSYQNIPVNDVGIRGKLSPGLSGIVAQVCSMVARGYLGLPVKPIQVENTQHSRDVLLAVFAGLDQKEIVRLNFNIRSQNIELRGMDGYPFFGYGYTQGQIERSTLPCFILSEKGAVVEGNPDTQELASAAAMLREGVSKVASYMIRTQGRDYKRHQSISNEIELAREGEWLLHTVCGLDLPQGPVRYQAVEQMLRSIPLDKVEDVFSHYLAGQRLYINRSKLAPEIDQVTLALELHGMVTFYDETAQYFIVDALSGSQILNNFYDDQAYPSPISGPPLDPGSPGEAVPGGVGGSGE